MSYVDKHIVETYSGLFEGLSSSNKIELIETLTRSLKIEENIKEKKFYSSFGAFGSEKSAEAIAKELKMSRKFRKKDIYF